MKSRLSKWLPTQEEHYLYEMLALTVSNWQEWVSFAKERRTLRVGVNSWPSLCKVSRYRDSQGLLPWAVDPVLAWASREAAEWGARMTPAQQLPFSIIQWKIQDA